MERDCGIRNHPVSCVKRGRAYKVIQGITLCWYARPPGGISSPQGGACIPARGATPETDGTKTTRSEGTPYRGWSVARSPFGEMRRSFGTHLYIRRPLPRALLWAGMRCPVGTWGIGRSCRHLLRGWESGVSPLPGMRCPVGTRGIGRSCRHLRGDGNPGCRPRLGRTAPWGHFFAPTGRLHTSPGCNPGNRWHENHAF